MRIRLAVPASILVFVVGATVYVSARKDNEIKPFVATFSYYRLNGTPSSPQVWVIKVASTGKSKTLRYNSVDGHLQQLPEDPAFPNWSMPEFSQEMWRDFSSPGFLQAHPEFVGEDQICGLKVFVHKVKPGLDAVERWYSPETGPIALKTVVDLGDEGWLVAEATNVQFRAVSEEELQ